MSSQTSLVVYTCLTGDKEELSDPLARLGSVSSDLKLHFVCLTDNPELRSDRWQVITYDTLGLPSDKASRLPKARPHAFFSSISAFSLYVDNTVQFKRLPNSQDLSTSQGHLFKLFQHNGRKTIMEEAAAIATLGYDTSQNLIEQLEHYARFMPLQDITPLSTCTVMLRDHSNPIVQHHGDFWWAQILAFTRRDQMSFDFSRIQTNCYVEYWAGTKHDNDLVHPQDNFSHQRVLANFDEKRYLWHHQNDPQAVKNPKKHYLASNPTQADAIRFSRRDTDPLNLFCHLFGSSLGSSISPRRRVTQVLYRVLQDSLDADYKDAFGICVYQNDEKRISRADFESSCKGLQTALGLSSFHTAILSQREFLNLHNFFLDHLDLRGVGLIFLTGLELNQLIKTLQPLLDALAKNTHSVTLAILIDGKPSAILVHQTIEFLQIGLNRACKSHTFFPCSHDSAQLGLLEHFLICVF